MPASFQATLLVAALASLASAENILNLDEDKFTTGKAPEQKFPEVNPEHAREPILSHEHDADDYRYLEEEKLRQGHKHWQEVHHPQEDIDFGSHEDLHRHYFPRDDRHHPREASEQYMHRYGDHRYYDNAMPKAVNEDNVMKDNVLDDDDPAICFVKAYARKPLGEPKKQQSNHMDYWYDDYEEVPDEYGDYTDSSEDYYDEDELASSEEEHADEETSSEEEEDGEGLYDNFDFNDDLWDKERAHHQHSHAQYFDLANQQATPEPAPAAESDSDAESQESAESADESPESDDDANAYAPRRRRAKGQRRRRTRRHPTAGPHPRTRQPHPRAHARRPVQRPLHPHDPDAPYHPQLHRDLQRRGQGHQADLPTHRRSPHDRHAPPPSARRHRKGQRPAGQRPGQPQTQRKRRPAQRQQRPQQQRRRRQRPQKKRAPSQPTNDETLQPVAKGFDPQTHDELNCPKFFEKTEMGCEKPLSLWRGNGQTKKCRNCQKCEDKWYPACPPSFVVTECDVCAPVCPDGMIDHDQTCMMPGLAAPECGADEQLIDGECYRQCPGQTSEFDILCFGLCPIDMYKCGHTLCLKSDQQCPQYVADKAIDLEKLVDRYKRKDVYGSRLINLSHMSMFPFPECH